MPKAENLCKEKHDYPAGFSPGLGAWGQILLMGVISLWETFGLDLSIPHASPEVLAEE